MSRPFHIEYPEALYHKMNRGMTAGADYVLYLVCRGGLIEIDDQII